MKLSEQERMIKDGAQGEAAAMAMSILVDLGQAVGAEEMVKITHVHTDSGFYLGDAGLEFVEHLAELKGKVAVPTSMNNTSYDIERGSVYGVPDELAGKIKRLEKAHLRMGAKPSWTCAPYQDGILPGKGEMVAWSESNAIVFANSVLGARTNRTGDLVDICCALTGYAPRTGLYLDENRLAQFHARLVDFPPEIFRDECFYPLLGYFIGNKFGNKVVAVSGIEAQVTMDHLKGLGAAAASSGATALYHLTGITPEAQSLDSCCALDALEDTVNVSPADIKAAEELLWTAEGDTLDWVGLGCPHFSKDEFVRLTQGVQGRRISDNVMFTVFTSRSVMNEMKKFGIIKSLKTAGIEVFCDGCLLLYPNFIRSSGTMMTNSVKGANYIFSQAGFKAAYGSIEECVESAVTGKIVRGKSSWLK